MFDALLYGVCNSGRRSESSKSFGKFENLNFSNGQRSEPLKDFGENWELWNIMGIFWLKKYTKVSIFL